MAIMRTRHRRERRYAITLRSGNFGPTLTIGAGKLRLEFIRAEIVDRDPVFGDRHVPLAGYDPHRRRKTENGEPMQLRHE